MKHKYFIVNLLATLLISTAALAQREADTWYFGNKAGLDFSGGEPVAVFNGQLSAVEGCTTLSDSQGNLLFYTNGITVWNKHHVTMPNGTGLFGDFSSTQAAVIVQQPGSANLFYIFTTNALETDGGLRYSIVDVAANNGMGQVTAKNILLNASTCEKVSVIRHSNGHDIWLVTHLWNSDAFVAAKITPAGISPSQVISHVGSVVTADSDYANAIGYMKISADGSKLVTCHTFMGKAELFDFDTTTGNVSNMRQLCHDASVYGAEFSPDNTKLYLSAVEQKKIFQFDLTAENIAGSKSVIGTLPQSPGALQLAPNGKIYVAMVETDKLSVINSPNKLGTSCNLSVNSIDLEGRMCLLGLPTFNQSFLYTKVSAENLCIGGETGFAFEAGFIPTSLHWDFGDGATLNGEEPSHHYNTAGNYTVTVTASYPGGAISRTKEIKILAAPMANQIAPQGFCIDSAQPYALSSNTAALLAGQPAGQFSVAYFPTLSDAEQFTNQLPDDYTLSAGSVTIYANIANASGCSTIGHFVLNAFEKPNGIGADNLHACDGLLRDGRANFDLDAKADEILASQPEGCTVGFYESPEDAENYSHPISGAYTNEAENQAVYARITGAGGCYKIVALTLIVDKCSNPEDFDIFPKFFTPNGDGFNDVWQMKSELGTPAFKLEIFDRYGRLVKTIADTDLEWNGTYGGRDLPSDDYWFVLSGPQISQYRGHFSLKR